MIRLVVFALSVVGCFCVNTVDEHHDEDFPGTLEYDFKELLNETGSPSIGKLSAPALNQLLDNLNENCLRADIIFAVLGVDPSGMDDEQFAQASWIIVSYLKDNGNLPCNNTEEFKELVQNARTGKFENGSICRSNISNLILEITQAGKYQPRESATCISTAQLLPECTEDLNVVEDAIARLVIAMSRGMCFLPEINFFTQDLFEYFNSSDDTLTLQNFETLLEKFNLGEEMGDHEEHEEDEEHARKKRNADDEISVVASRCYSAEELLSIVGQGDGGVLSKKGLLDVCPAILQQTVRGACNGEDESETPTSSNNNSSYTTAQKYGYGTAAVLLISLLAFGGLLLFPSIGSTSYKLTMQFFIALGVGTLSGDALLHLIPEVVGLHGHEEEEGHAHEEEEEDQSYIFKLLVVIAGIYFFYLLENVLRLYNQLKGKNVSFHQHHESENDHNHANNSAASNHRFARNSIKTVSRKDENGSSESNQTENDSKDMKASVSDDDIKDVNTTNTACCGVTPVGIMVLIGDILHNFGDGLALGVAFSSSAVGGIGASIAIFCHELPHEFGDFAIYLRNGMSKFQALFLNFMAACCAFIGLYIGLSVGENVEARQWMLAVIAGMFLYISLVDVLHEMVEEVSEEHPLLQFFLQNFGMCLGWTILLLLALYEDKIRLALD